MFDIQNPKFIRQINSDIKKVVFKRDQHICRFCGLHSNKYHAVVNPENNWRNLDTILTACIFCQQCFLLDSVSQMRSGVLIFFPDYTQVELNRLAMEIYIARISQPRGDEARWCLDNLLNRRAAATSALGTDSPAELACLIRNAQGSNDKRAELSKRTVNIRLLPLDRRIIREADLEFNQFPQILAYWRSKGGPFPSIANLKRLDYFIRRYK